MGSLENKVAASQANLGGGRPTGRKRHAEAQVHVGTGLFRKPHMALASRSTSSEGKHLETRVRGQVLKELVNVTLNLWTSF